MAIHQQTLEKLQHFPLHPVASESTTFTGATTNIADLKDFDGDIQIILDSGAAAASGTMTGKIQDSADGSTNWADVTGGGFTAVAQAAAKQVLTINRDGIKRYIRFVGTIAASGTTIYSVNGYGLKKYG
ncbi:MAG TPA: hypothetical protein DEP24_11575 [Mycobacterium sp.]|nr:hypothetical protein [Mycobacterium sp.]